MLEPVVEAQPGVVRVLLLVEPPLEAAPLQPVYSAAGGIGEFGQQLERHSGAASTFTLEGSLWGGCALSEATLTMLLSVAEKALVDTEPLLVSSFSKSEHRASGSGSNLPAAAHSCRARRNSSVMKSACSTVLRWHVLPWFFKPMKSDGGLTGSTAVFTFRREKNAIAANGGHQRGAALGAKTSEQIALYQIATLRLLYALLPAARAVQPAQALLPRLVGKGAAAARLLPLRAQAPVVEAAAASPRTPLSGAE